MARLIPIAERITRARKLIQEARDLPVPPESGLMDLNYVAQVKDLIQQARDLIKFISYQPSATLEIKNEVKAIFQEADHAEKEILHR